MILQKGINMGIKVYVVTGRCGADLIKPIVKVSRGEARKALKSEFQSNKREVDYDKENTFCEKDYARIDKGDEWLEWEISELVVDVPNVAPVKKARSKREAA